MKKKPFITVFAIAAIMACVYLVLYNSGYIGITDDKINQEQMKTVFWHDPDYVVVGSGADDSALYVGIMYMKDYSDARYFIYINKSGLSFGWHFLRGGNLADAEGLMAFECGKYGTAYVALNAEYEIQKIVFEDGREPSVTENTNWPIVEQSEGTVYFYDQSGKVIEPSVITLVD